MVTIKDVATEAGVSVATVSRVINKSPKASNKSIVAVNSAMQKLGYRPNAAARALVSQNSNTVGVVVADVSDPFFGTLIKSIDSIAKQNGKHVLIGNGYHNADDERQALEILINNRCDAIVLHAKGLSDEELVKYAKEVKGLVIINREVPQIESRCISLDNQYGAYLATSHLIDLGHKHIACIASSHDIEDTHARIAGYKAALSEHNLTLSDTYIEHGLPNSDGGELAMANLLSKSLQISAVVAYNDYMAAGAIEVLKTNSLNVPQDISIIGFDDGLISKYVYPKLTSIRYPIAIMAEQAINLALALAKNEQLSLAHYIYMPTYVQRDSVTTPSDKFI